MTVQATAGVRMLACILDCVIRHGPIRVADICVREGLPRSSGFAIAAKLAGAGLVTRLPNGQLVQGPALVQLGYAAAGLSALAGPAEAVLAWLRLETGATVALTGSDMADVLLSLPEAQREAGVGTGMQIQAAVHGPDGTVRAWLTLGAEAALCHADAARLEATLMRASLTLAACLVKAGAVP